MAETAPPASRSEAAPERTIGVPFKKGHGRGRPKGIIDKRRLGGEMAARALEARAWSVIRDLLQARAWRSRFEAARLVIAYVHGTPRQSLEITGGIGDLASELAAALAEVRSRRAALPAVRVEVASGERAVNEKGENRPEIGDSRHSTERMSALPALPAEVVETRQETSGAAIVSDDAEHGHADDRATAGATAGRAGAVGDPRGEGGE